MTTDDDRDLLREACEAMGWEITDHAGGPWHRHGPDEPYIIGWPSLSAPAFRCACVDWLLERYPFTEFHRWEDGTLAVVVREAPQYAQANRGTGPTLGHALARAVVAGKRAMEGEA